MKKPTADGKCPVCLEDYVPGCDSNPAIGKCAARTGGWPSKSPAPVDWNYATPTNLEEVCKMLERRIEVHQNWLDYLMSNPNDEYAKNAVKHGVGTVESHRTYIQQYKAAINLIRAS